MKKLDALIVYNVDSELGEIKDFLKVKQVNSALFVSTSTAYPFEKLALSSEGKDYTFYSFADLMTESDMEKFDERADEVCNLPSMTQENPVLLWQSTSLRYKNIFVKELLDRDYKFEHLLVFPGLGILEDIWVSNSRFTIEQLAPKRSTLRGLKNLLNFFRPDFFKISFSTHSLVFIGSTKRLKLKEGHEIKKMSLIEKVFSVLKREKIFTTIHQFSISTRLFAKLFRLEIPIVVDGHHPSNYSYSYIHLYKNTFNPIVPDSFINELYFRNNGCRTINHNNFLQPFLLKDFSEAKPINCLVAMNHAGDWSSLINRSDTDEFILRLLEIAKKVPHVNFNLRLHPTMNTFLHEGVQSKKRIELLVDGSNLPNLKVSKGTLDQDMSSADFILSEYSQVLIDGWGKGILGVGFNPTKRRSYMYDYENIGFTTFTKEEDLIALFSSDEKWQGFITKQRAAVSKFNEMQKQWLKN